MLKPSQYSELYTVDPDVAVRGYWLLWYLDYYGLRARISEGYRSQQRQTELYALGRTRPGTIVTNTLHSRHTSRRAFDIDFVGRQPSAVPQSWWDGAGIIGEALGLRWGGRWALRDYRHFEG